MDWYRKHGTADERLKSYYYQGRVYQNAGDNEAAMGSFVRAEAYAGQSDDKTAAGLLYLAMSNISMDIFDMDKVLEYSSDAEKIFKETEDTARYSSSLLKVCTYYSMYVLFHTGRLREGIRHTGHSCRLMGQYGYAEPEHIFPDETGYY